MSFRCISVASKSVHFTPEANRIKMASRSNFLPSSYPQEKKIKSNQKQYLSQEPLHDLILGKETTHRHKSCVCVADIFFDFLACNEGILHKMAFLMSNKHSVVLIYFLQTVMNSTNNSILKKGLRKR